MRYLLRQPNYYITLSLVSLVLGLLFQETAIAQTIDFTRSTNVLLTMRGSSNSYDYIGRHFDGRYNSRLRRFEFLMPLQEVYASNSATEMNVFNTVFIERGTSQELSEGFRLYAYLNESVPNFTDFRNGRTLVLEGECSIGGVKYKMPVTMQVRYQDGALYYSLDTSITNSFQNIVLPAAAAGVQLKQIQVYLRDGVIRMLLEG
ncbi:hypothetical protein Q0590_17150 [Rhodocytophaga aerolata]|uniref:YceI family protein n=1 Tax=Rhodocytophaga aerolata TaxID=455078 RepID=A0ABT8R9W2_9BACT|nr:hypothetical protein [Rhodocytophaga aerolata]MDO1448003.1 hypothetical protein [Rhodocytophaga aerolata]